MKMSKAILMTSAIMIMGGFISFGISQMNEELSSGVMRHGGVFAGLLGVGTGIAGTLLYIIDRYKVEV